MLHKMHLKHEYLKRLINPVDTRKTIDYTIKPHTYFSQIVEGVYPAGTTQDEVEKLVKGSFGGRFVYFRDGKFKYVAYTD